MWELFFSGLVPFTLLNCSHYGDWFFATRLEAHWTSKSMTLENFAVGAGMARPLFSYSVWRLLVDSHTFPFFVGFRRGPLLVERLSLSLRFFAATLFLCGSKKVFRTFRPAFSHTAGQPHPLDRRDPLSGSRSQHPWACFGGVEQQISAGASLSSAVGDFGGFPPLRGPKGTSPFSSFVEKLLAHFRAL